MHSVRGAGRRLGTVRQGTRLAAPLGMVTLEARAAKDDSRTPRLSDRGRAPLPADERREPAAWVPMADFDDDLYADVPCTD